MKQYCQSPYSVCLEMQSLFVVVRPHSKISTQLPFTGDVFIFKFKFTVKFHHINSELGRLLGAKTKKGRIF